MKGLPPLSGISAFIQVAEVGAFNEAARQLGLSSSATSKAVSRLEEHLGIKLLHRTTRSISLTPEGERYLEAMRKIVDEIGVVSDEVANTSAAPKGRLRVAAPSAFGRLWLVDAIKVFQDRWPHVTVELTLEDRIVDLAGESVDIAIRAGGLDDTSYLIARHLFDTPLIVCAHPEYWAQHGKPSHPSELVNFNCLNFRSAETGRIYPWYFAEKDKTDSLVLPSYLEADDGEAVLQAARTGMGVSQMPGYLAKKAIDAGELEEVLSAFRPASSQFHAVYLERRLLSPRIRVFIDFLVEYTFHEKLVVD
ncbi:LysR family transcriptional regulator [Marinibactrum halimedae]|uniref:LysR family transcriptional regulator n=1 Tax=Marinibactrum halimedae TaxID=1444977 RepID=A0AA37T879_9GAMM|nr:LysR family transcriptional regulator [Marinibactrum halimedae]MCD9459436.1 LysR family transcriptional regulator [Marinibactrum halimedae]GLS27496.1 LysR family transcriptional regulator [Marinibactrum halimedae]